MPRPSATPPTAAHCVMPVPSDAGAHIQSALTESVAAKGMGHVRENRRTLIIGPPLMLTCSAVRRSLRTVRLNICYIGFLPYSFTVLHVTERYVEADV
jgi:hypothetical protein